MKIAVSSYSFGSYMNQDKLGLFGIIDKSAELMFDGIEFVDGDWAQPTVAKDVVKRCRERNLEVVAFCTSAEFLNTEDMEGEISRVKERLEFAASLGAKNFRHDMSCGVNGVSYEDALDRLGYCASAVAEYGKALGIVTTTENHGYFSQDGYRLEMLMKSVKSDNFGLLVDIGNFMCVDRDTVCEVELLAPYACHVHAKDFYFRSRGEICSGGGWFGTREGNQLCGAVIGEGDAKAEQCLNVLKKLGYDGYITVEYEGRDDNLVAIKKGRKAILDIWRA